MKKEYTIDADKWRCGCGHNALGDGYTRMLNEEGYMCCLGQISEQMGVEKQFLKESCDPEEVANRIINGNESSVAKQKYLTHNHLIKYIKKCKNNVRLSNLAKRAIDINDDKDLSTKERVEKLKALFADNGIKLRFKNIKKHFK